MNSATSATSNPLDLCIAEATSAARDGLLKRTTLHEITTVHGLPALHFGDLVEALAVAGISIDSTEEVEDPGDSPDDDRGWNGSGLDVFLKQSAHRILSAEEEVSLAITIERGRMAAAALEANPCLDVETRRELRRRVTAGKRAASEFVTSNIRLVVHNAKAFKQPGGVSLEFEDLIQEGIFGLVRAVEKFDHRKGFKFSTYATWWIRQALQRAAANLGRTVRLPVHVHDEIASLRHLTYALSLKGVTPTTTVIAAELGWTETKVRRLTDLGRIPLSLDSKRDDGAALGDLLPAEGQLSVEEVLETQWLSEVVIDRLSSILDEREMTILVRRFGLQGNERETLESIGDDLGITRERVRQLEALALKKAARSSVSDELRELLPER
jgi:RNA polymerase primary sigma factor